MEKQKKRKKKNQYIVIKGANIPENNLRCGRSTKRHRGRSQNTGHNYISRKKEQRKAIIVKLEEWGQKLEIMKNKKKLGTKIKIENDLTLKEREIQPKIKEIANEERRTNKKKVKIGSQKMYVGNALYTSDDKQQSLCLNKYPQRAPNN